MQSPPVILDLSPVVHRKAGLATYAQRLATHLVSEFGTAPLSAFYYGAANTLAQPLQPPLSTLPLKTMPWPALRWRLSVAAGHFAGVSRDRWVMKDDGRTTSDGSQSLTPNPQPLFHATEHLLPRMKIRSVFTFHDAIYALFPQFHTRKNLWYLNTMMPRFLGQANAIIAVSECSKRDCMRLYGVPAHKVHVIAEAADPHWRPIHNATELDRVRAKYGLPKQFILFLATLEPRKNLPALLDAFKSLTEQPTGGDGETPSLVIAGKKGWMFAPIFEKVRALGLEQRVTFTGYVPDEDAPALMSAARMFVFPSLYEGFGLPVLEAMQTGTPVVCSNASSLPEVAGDAALMFDPRDTAAMARAMREMWQSPALRQQHATLGLQQARQFSWQRAAQQTMQLYQTVAGAA